MGYRSDVALILSNEGNRKLSDYYRSLSEEDKTELESLLNGSDDYLHNDKGEHLFIWESCKWYTEFPEVKLIEKFLDTISDEDYYFVRIGEDLCDVEELGNFYSNDYDVYVNREIHHSCGSCRHLSEWRPNDE